MKIKVYKVLEKHNCNDKVVAVEESRKEANKEYKRLKKINKNKEYYILKSEIELEEE